jgi:hypothetical protein
MDGSAVRDRVDAIPGMDILSSWRKMVMVNLADARRTWYKRLQ